MCPTQSLCCSVGSAAKSLQNFFIKANDIIENTSTSVSEELHGGLQHALEKAKADTHDALCDSFNTPAVMNTISDLITTFNSSDKTSIRSETTQVIARWITSLVNIMGLNGDAPPVDPQIGWSGVNIPDYGKPYIPVLSRLRDNLRQKARAKGVLSKEAFQEISNSVCQVTSTDSSSNPFEKVLLDFQSEIKSLPDDSSILSKLILELCDRVRDVDLWDMGIYLEDRDGSQGALIRPVTKYLRQARQEKEARENQKEKARKDREAEAAAKAHKGKLRPQDMFKTEEYTKWDVNGLPVKDATGEEITKSKGKKLKKEWDRQNKLHEDWLEAKRKEEERQTKLLEAGAALIG